MFSKLEVCSVGTAILSRFQRPLTKVLEHAMGGSRRRAESLEVELRGSILQRVGNAVGSFRCALHSELCDSQP